ncbi:MAG TPA: hypothetical protein PLI51_02020 [bacterium]|nr:hypothetical protein [bacterium]HPQ65493.1 hypothetical protein [bacterium]
MRKKIFVIHGKGVNNGIGKEGGGDLDTVSSNAFYMVWAQHSLGEELGREPEYGRDYEFDFLNYSEGVESLLAHRGCDVFIPDFPIDALAPRLRLMLIDDMESAELLNRYTEAADDFRLWIVTHASSVSREFKDIFNATYRQVGKILEHREKAALQSALEVLALLREGTELDADLSGAEESIRSAAEGLRRGLIGFLTGTRLGEFKKTLLGHLRDQNKEKMLDLLDDHEAMVAFDLAVQEDMSTSGRINYTDELLVVVLEAAAYLVRGFKQLRDLPWEEGPARDYRHTLRAIQDAVILYLRTLGSLLGTGAGSLPSAAGRLEKMARLCEGLRVVFAEIQDRIPPPVRPETEFPIRLHLIEDATGKPVAGIEVVIKRLAGEGSFRLPGGETSGAGTLVIPSAADGSIETAYLPASPQEEYRLSITFDDLQEIILPTPVSAPDEDPVSSYDQAGPDVLEEAFEEKEEIPEEMDRAMQVSLAMIERQFKNLKDQDVNVVSIDDHHPYTPEIFGLLSRLVEEGVIGHLQVASLPRGEELPVEKQKCGADLIYGDRVRGRPWDNPGLAELDRIAHLQDLHIELTPLGMALSKLIGSKYSKVEIARGLASVSSLEEMTTIMERLGWDKLVEAYEEALEKVYPRTEQVVGVIELGRRGEEADPIRITAALSPFCDAKKGEVQVNVASAIHYLLSRKKNLSDYFFYCYGSQLMTTRRPNENETTLNLSTMCQHIGTRADGGHSGAATCKPSSNPLFPRRLEKVKDTNFLGYLDYLADRVADYSGLDKIAVRPLPFPRYGDPVERALAHVRENLYRIRLEGKKDPGDMLTVLFTRAPRVAYALGEEKPSFLQIINYLRRDHEFDYLVFAQGMLYRVILANVGDSRCRIDLPRLARTVGWSEDGGCPILAVADIRKNRKVKKRLRRLLHPHLPQLARLIGGFIEETSEYRISSLEPLVPEGATAAFEPVLERMKASTWLIDLVRPDGSPAVRVLATLSVPYDRKKGEADPPLPVVADYFREHSPHYLIYSEAFLAFPRKQPISALMRVQDPDALIDCSRAVSALAGKRFCGDAEVAEFMPGFLEDSPLGKTPLAPGNYREFLDYVVPRIAEASGLTVGGVRGL